MPLNPQARATYRALLREHPRRTLQANSTTPLHNRLRQVFRATDDASSSPSSSSTGTSSQTTTTDANTNAHVNASRDEEIETTKLKIQEAEQIAKYARAQRTYKQMLEMYYPGIALDEEEKIRLTARRVGWDLPVTNGEKA